MTKIYNRFSEREKRKLLRNNMTKAEEILWNELKQKKLGVKFRRQLALTLMLLTSTAQRLSLQSKLMALLTAQMMKLHTIRTGKKELANLHIKFLRFWNKEVYDDLNSVTGRIRNEISNLS